MDQLLTNLFCLLVIVGIHEYGHFFFAKRYGIVPTNFSIGFGPELFGLNHEGTRFSWRIIPLGGFVEFSDQEEKVEEILKSLTKWQRIKVYFAGPLANLLLCIVMAAMAVFMGVLPEPASQLPVILQLLIAIIGTVVLFFLAIPISIYVLYSLVIKPVENMAMVDGPIGIITGEHIPTEVAAVVGYGGEVVFTLWLMSLAVGSFNLLPISILDGGRIFGELFSKYRLFTATWFWSTSGFLVIMVVYLFTTDIVKLF